MEKSSLSAHPQASFLKERKKERIFLKSTYVWYIQKDKSPFYFTGHRLKTLRRSNPDVQLGEWTWFGLVYDWAGGKIIKKFNQGYRDKCGTLIYN